MNRLDVFADAVHTARNRDRASGPVALAFMIASSATVIPSTSAQELAGVRTEPAEALVGQQVTVVVTFNAPASQGIYCGITIALGDGNSRDVRVTEKDFPVRLTHTYQAPGNYAVSAEGKTLVRGLHTASPCAGQSRSAAILVRTNAPPPSAPGAAASCPANLEVRNINGQPLTLIMNDVIANAGGVRPAREQVNEQILRTQETALDDAKPAAERDRARAFLSAALYRIRDYLGRCR